MPTIREILETLEGIAPARLAFSFDRVGLQVGDLDAAVDRAAVSLDRSLGAIRFADSRSCQLLLAHHPLIFQPLDSVDSRSLVGRSVLELATKRIAFVAAHSNWDCARGGVNDALASLFGLRDVEPFGSATEVHSGETVPCGRIGNLKVALPLAEFAAHSEQVLRTKTLVWGERNQTVATVALVGGAGDSEWVSAQQAGADVFLTGEVKQHVALEASESGMCLIAAGHYATEQPGVAALTARMAEAMPKIEWFLYAPDEGLHGRPF